jgi:hypothetical protein
LKKKKRRRKRRRRRLLALSRRLVMDDCPSDSSPPITLATCHASLHLDLLFASD